MHRSQLGPRRVEIGAGREAAEQLGHAVLAASHHRRRQMVSAGDDVGDELGLGGIGHRRLEHPDDLRRPRAEANGLPDHRGVAVQAAGPEAMGQDRCTRRRRSVVVLGEETSGDRPKPHHLEERAVHHAGAHLPRLAETDHRERDGRELADGRDRGEPISKILHLRDRERRILVTVSGGALPDVQQTALVLVHERPQQHGSHQAEDRRVRADAEREGQHDRCRQTLGPGEGPHGELQLAKQAHGLFPGVRRLHNTRCRRPRPSTAPTRAAC